VDTNGNCFVTGSCLNSTTLGTNAVSGPTFIAEYDTFGNLLWVQSLSWGLNAGGVALDSAGNCYVTANGSGGGTAKFTEGGALDWITNASVGCGIGVDGLGNCYVAAAGPTATLTKIDGSDGAAVWSNALPGYGYAATADSAGNSYVTGPGGSPLFIAKYGANGNGLWTNVAANAWGRGVAVDMSGNVFVTGGFDSTANFGGTNSLVSVAGDNIFVVAYDNSGNTLWAKGAGGMSGNNGGGAIAVDNTAVYITGQFVTSANFDSITVSNTGFRSIFVAKLLKP
jgi:hypothetical protein